MFSKNKITLLSNKQKWRRCNSKLIDLSKYEKRVRFNDTVYQILIPTKEEINKIIFYYESCNNFYS